MEFGGYTPTDAFMNPHTRDEVCIFHYKDITMRTHLADVMLIVAKSALNNEPFQVTTEHIIDIAPECPEEDPDDMDDEEDDDEPIEVSEPHLLELWLRDFWKKE